MGAAARLGFSDSTRSLRRHIGPLGGSIALAGILLGIPIVLTRLLPGRRPAPPQWTALLVVLVGLGVIIGSVLLHRRDYLHPRHTIIGVLIGLGIVVPATWGLVQFSPISVPPVSGSPTLRHYYPLIDLLAGTATVIGSVVLG